MEPLSVSVVLSRMSLAEHSGRMRYSHLPVLLNLSCLNLWLKTIADKVFSKGLNYDSLLLG